MHGVLRHSRQTAQEQQGSFYIMEQALSFGAQKSGILKRVQGKTIPLNGKNFSVKLTLNGK